jgi:hypothetical protein
MIVRRSASLARASARKTGRGPCRRETLRSGVFVCSQRRRGRALNSFAHRISQCGGFRRLSRRRRAAFMLRHRRAHALALICSLDAAAAFKAARLDLNARAGPRSRARWAAARRLGRREHGSSCSLPRRVVGRHSRSRRALCGAPESVPSSECRSRRAARRAPASARRDGHARCARARPAALGSSGEAAACGRALECSCWLCSLARARARATPRSQLRAARPRLPGAADRRPVVRRARKPGA